MRQRISVEILENIRYKIWQGDLANHSTFKFWKNEWREIFVDRGSEQALESSEFLRQDKITTLSYNEEIVGMHLIKKYSVSDFDKDPYLAKYSPAFADALRFRKVKLFQALQYFIVQEKWSVKNTLVNFGAIIAQLSLRHQLLDQLDATVTIGRKDIPVTALAKKLGFIEIGASEMHNGPVAELVCFTAQPHPKDDVNQLTELYWNARTSHFINPKRSAA